MKTRGRYRKPIVKPLLAITNMIKRKSYCFKYIRDSFNNVIFSDEGTFQLFRNSIRVFNRRGEKRISLLESRSKQKIQIWGGALSKKRRVSLAFYEGRLNAEMYKKLLMKNLRENADLLHGHKNWRFVQDNAPCHSTQEVKQYIRRYCKDLLEHPPQSPDLDPIEQIWALLKKRIEICRPSIVHFYQLYTY